MIASRGIDLSTMMQEYLDQVLVIVLNGCLESCSASGVTSVCIDVGFLMYQSLHYM